MSININGIRGKKLELQVYLASEEPEIVAIKETKIDKYIVTNELVPGSLEYDVYRKDRWGKGGGVKLLVKRHLNSGPVNKLKNDSLSRVGAQSPLMEEFTLLEVVPTTWWTNRHN